MSSTTVNQEQPNINDTAAAGKQNTPATTAKQIQPQPQPQPQEKQIQPQKKPQPQKIKPKKQPRPQPPHSNCTCV
jgi:hypothetical protein